MLTPTERRAMLDRILVEQRNEITAQRAADSNKDHDIEVFLMLEAESRVCRLVMQHLMDTLANDGEE